ncbi:mucin-5AC isoform X2 [Cyclopterus lumpus]|uniref:mucin-5AC isoform X2 n=1 Tax=Cyclopterus lumpus TaxID=8103 RepID=UPI0014872996|nr:mucin-5AC isoform X2 [Cyclopterus lumpus]
MKSWSRLCFLVIAISSISRGQNVMTVAPDPQGTPSPLPSETSSSPQSRTSANATDPTVSTTEAEGTSATTERVTGSAAAQTTAASGGATSPDGEEVTSAASSLATTVTIEEAGHSSWGYVILVLILLVIIFLCVILYFLRKVSRTYSFELHRQAPANHLNEPIGTFEQVYLGDLDRVTSGDLTLPPVTDGSTAPSDSAHNFSRSAPQEQPDASGKEASPTSNTSPSLGRRPASDTPSPLSCTNMFFHATAVCSSDSFVEINLDEAALCDQLLTSPEAPPSSVLPFSPFSFSSSSSSSSSSLHLH